VPRARTHTHTRICSTLSVPHASHHQHLQHTPHLIFTLVDKQTTDTCHHSTMLPTSHTRTQVLGKGSYSTVHLAEDKSTRKVYAMKILEKAFIQKERKEK
jgi:hypothetical protein